MTIVLRSFTRASLGAALFLLITGCSGGSGSSPTVPSAATQSVQQVTGTLQIVGSGATSSFAHRSLGARRPDYVSVATKHAALFIDQAVMPAGTTTSCTTSSCIISWSAALNVPASHTFSVEIDDGNTYVLGEGQASYSITAGTNTLGTLSLNPVLSFVFVYPGSCSGNSCTVSLGTSDGANYLIEGANNTTTPVSGTPTSGTVFDNYNGAGSKALTVTSSNASVGTISGTSASPYASYASGTFTILGLNASGTYIASAVCDSGVSGNFNVTIGTGTPSGDITSFELQDLNITYPTVATEEITPVFTCTSGAISLNTTASGTLPIK